jgi:C-terminal processing protease CtpA/Prc
MMPRRGFLKSTALACMGLALTAGCGSEDRQPAAPEVVAQDPSLHLAEILGIMERESINRLTIDWPAFRRTVLAEAASAQTIADTYPAIRTALRLLGDGHSSYLSATRTGIFVPIRTCSSSGAPTPQVPPSIGYVRVGSIGSDGAAAFSDAIHQTIRAADHDAIAGWIVDLRGNGGGNMWPMIAGVGPILGEGVVGHFISPVGVVVEWSYRRGSAIHDSLTQHTVASPYRLRREEPRVAVLTDAGVASAGEAVAIAFRQRPDTRSFGSPTCGLSTANRGFRLSDGALLNLTTSVMADRRLIRYGGPVIPDEVVDPRQAADRAVEWILNGR